MSVRGSLIIAALLLSACGPVQPRRGVDSRIQDAAVIPGFETAHNWVDASADDFASFPAAQYVSAG
jgi:hypothetical protein